MRLLNIFEPAKRPSIIERRRGAESEHDGPKARGKTKRGDVSYRPLGSARMAWATYRHVPWWSPSSNISPHPPGSLNLFLLFLFCAVPPTIAPFSFNKDLSEGVRAQVTCMVEKGDPPFTIAWSKDGEAIAGPSPAAAGFGNTGITGPRHTQTPAGLRVTNIDAHSSTIVIERVSAAHSGNYTCMARNSVAEVLWTAELIVRGKVEPMIIRIMRNHTCKDGRDRTIIYIYVFLHRLLSPLCLILFLFFFFCTTANAPSYYISCRITSSCRALAGLG